MLRGGTDSRELLPRLFPGAGNTLVLSIVLCAVAIALVLTLATVTQMHIERKRLLALADAAAIHAASAIDEPAYFAEPGSRCLSVTQPFEQRLTTFLPISARASARACAGCRSVPRRTP